MSKHNVQRIGARSLLLAVALAAGIGFAASEKPANAGACGTCTGGRFDYGALTCGGAYADCENCTVCTKPRI